MSDEQNDGISVVNVEFYELGCAITFSNPKEDRAGLQRQHVIALTYDQEMYGEDAARIRSDLEDLAFDLFHNYNQQAKE